MVKRLKIFESIAGPQINPHKERCTPLLPPKLLLLFAIFFWYWGLNSGLHLEPFYQPFL
jgi:hypothetical protein